MISESYLETFRVLCETRHFTKTAKLLHMTQPGVSQHLKKLEEELETALILKRGKSFELTEAGQKLYEFSLSRAKEEESFREALLNDREDKGVVSIGCSGSMALHLYSKLITRQENFFDLELFLEAAPNRLIINKVREGELKIGLITSKVEAMDLNSKAIGKEELCLVLPKGGEKGRVDLEYLNEQGLINHPDAFDYVNRVFSKNFQDDFKGVEELKVRGYINQINQILLPISKGVGYTVLPKRVVENSIYRDSLGIVPLKYKVEDTIYLIMKSRIDLPKRYHWFLEKIEESL